MNWMKEKRGRMKMCRILKMLDDLIKYVNRYVIDWFGFDCGDDEDGH